MEPGFQGMEIGYVVMRMLCDHVDDCGNLARLETDKIENVLFFTSFGFELVSEMPVLSTSCWVMRREPR